MLDIQRRITLTDTTFKIFYSVGKGFVNILKNLIGSGARGDSAAPLDCWLGAAEAVGGRDALNFTYTHTHTHSCTQKENVRSKTGQPLWRQIGPFMYMYVRTREGNTLWKEIVLDSKPIHEDKNRHNTFITIVRLALVSSPMCEAKSPLYKPLRLLLLRTIAFFSRWERGWESNVKEEGPGRGDKGVRLLSRSRLYPVEKGFGLPLLAVWARAAPGREGGICINPSWGNGLSELQRDWWGN